MSFLHLDTSFFLHFLKSIIFPPICKSGVNENVGGINFKIIKIIEISKVFLQILNFFNQINLLNKEKKNSYI